METHYELVFVFYMFQGTVCSMFLPWESFWSGANHLSAGDCAEPVLCLYGWPGNHSDKSSDGVQKDREELGPGVKEKKESWDMKVEWKALGWVQLLINVTAVLS